MRARFTAFSLLVCFLASAAPAKGSVPLQPSSKWLVDFADSQCVASRQYGTPEAPLVLALKAPPIGDVIELAILRPGKAGRYAEQVEGHFGVDDRDLERVSMLVFGAGEPEKRVLRMILPIDQFNALMSASSVHIRARGEIDQRLALSQLGSVMEVMEDCVVDLRKVWNVVESEEAPSPLIHRATGDLSGLFRGNDYPGDAIHKGQEGKVKLAMLIDETGRVADCTVVETSGVAALDGQACALLKERARFEHAVGPDGKPAKDAHLQVVRWEVHP